MATQLETQQSKISLYALTGGTSRGWEKHNILQKTVSAYTAVSYMSYNLTWSDDFRFTQETYRAFLLHFQNIKDVILLWRASRPLPLQTQPGHPRHLQLWREGWQWHTAWGEQVHHFTELAGEGRERWWMGKNGRERQKKHSERHMDEDSGWKKQQYNNGQQGGCHSGDNRTLMHLPCTHVIFGCKAERVSWSWRKLGHFVLLLRSIVALFINTSALPL